jgi:hypothetical protein
MGMCASEPTPSNTRATANTVPARTRPSRVGIVSSATTVAAAVNAVTRPPSPGRPVVVSTTTGTTVISAG